MSTALIHIDSPLGRYAIVASTRGVTHIQPEGSAKLPACTPEASPEARSHAEHGASALARYFAGEKDAFDALVLAAEGTEFQRRVWRALRDIPYGHSESYGELAARIGRAGGLDRKRWLLGHEGAIEPSLPLR
jgi:methylated-DNA-[protein]-cysteine S-methyltransferase